MIRRINPPRIHRVAMVNKREPEDMAENVMRIFPRSNRSMNRPKQSVVASPVASPLVMFPAPRILKRSNGKSSFSYRSKGSTFPRAPSPGGLQRLGELLQPVYTRILERSRAGHHWQMYETRQMVFEQKAGKVGYRWWLWVIITADTVVYLLEPPTDQCS